MVLLCAVKCYLIYPDIFDLTAKLSILKKIYDEWSRVTYLVSDKASLCSSPDWRYVFTSKKRFHAMDNVVFMHATIWLYLLGLKIHTLLFLYSAYSFQGYRSASASET